MKWLLATLSLACFQTSHEPGVVVIVGGGKVPESVQRHFVQLAGGKEAHIAVLPQASSRPTRGESSVAMFTALGAHAYIVPLEDQEQAHALIREATGIWFPGGSQTKLYDALRDAKLIDILRTRHHAGLTFGGSSAGAAIMSEIMIPKAPKKPGLITGNTPTDEGLGLTKQLIIDQHFVARGRLSRLLSAVIDHPDRLGVGIDESTAIVVRQGEFTVMGKGSVVIIDAHQAKTSKGKRGDLQSSSGVTLHILKAGQTHRFP
jgi:cyanophycinase